MFLSWFQTHHKNNVNVLYKLAEFNFCMKLSIHEDAISLLSDILENFQHYIFNNYPDDNLLKGSSSKNLIRKKNKLLRNSEN